MFSTDYHLLGEGGNDNEITITSLEGNDNQQPQCGGGGGGGYGGIPSRTHILCQYTASLSRQNSDSLRAVIRKGGCPIFLYNFVRKRGGHVYNNFYPTPDPYQQRLDTMQRQILPRLEIIHVNGENGARAFRMAPNSNAILLDDTRPVVWLVQSDGAGYHTATPYTIAPIEQVQPEDAIKSLENRLSRLEAMINESHAQQVGPEQPRTGTAAE